MNGKQRFVDEKRRYEQYQKSMRDGSALIDDTLLMAYTLGWMDGRKPKWKYEKEEPPKSLLILDDVLSSPAISQSSGLTRIATLNRHIAPLKEDHMPHAILHHPRYDPCLSTATLIKERKV